MMKSNRILTGTSAGVIISKPFLIIFWAGVMLLTAVGGYLLPVFRSILELGTLSESNFIETVMSFVQLLYEYSQKGTIVVVSTIVLLMILFLVSVLGSVIFSGYFNVLNSTLSARNQKSAYKEGIKQFFNKIFIMNFTIAILGIILIVILIAASVPALVITNAITNRGTEMIPAVLFVDTITALVFFFVILFFRVYSFYWYPAVINKAGKPFKTAREIVNKNFWRITGIFLLFDASFVGIQWFLTKQDDNLFFTLIKWVFFTCFYALFSTYIFVSFKKYFAKDNFKSSNSRIIKRKKKGKKKNEKI